MVKYNFMNIFATQTDKFTERVLFLNVDPILIGLDYSNTNLYRKDSNDIPFEKEGKFYIGYVDKSEQSYDTFENIIPIDSVINFDKVSVDTFRNMSDDIWSCHVNNSSSLLEIDKLNIYSEIDNSNERGGQRAIFLSIKLSDILTNELKKIADEKFLTNFRMVNSVFRFNKFKPTDNLFKRHYDTPFSDKSHSMYSKYTMIIYLTSGENPKGILKFNEDEIIQSIKTGNCIIFDQSKNHKGRPFIDEDKFFIRTELIYYIPPHEMEQDSNLASYFNSACYFTKMSKTSPEYSLHASRLFNELAPLRFQETRDEIKVPLIIKRLNGVIYITNGNNYYFSKKYSLKYIATLILQDYFGNDKIESLEFNREESIGDFLEIANIFYNNVNQLDLNTIDHICKNIDKHIIIQERQCELCDDFSPTSKKIYDNSFNNCVRLLKETSKNDTVVLFNGKIYVNGDNIIITDKAIIFKTNELDKGINFASCQCGCFRSEEYISFETKTAESFSLPNINYTTGEKSFKLSIDMFNNGFIFKSKFNFYQPHTFKPNEKDKLDFIQDDTVTKELFNMLIDNYDSDEEIDIFNKNKKLPKFKTSEKVVRFKECTAPIKDLKPKEIKFDKFGRVGSKKALSQFVKFSKEIVPAQYNTGQFGNLSFSGLKLGHWSDQYGISIPKDETPFNDNVAPSNYKSGPIFNPIDLDEIKVKDDKKDEEETIDWGVTEKDIYLSLKEEDF